MNQVGSLNAYNFGQYRDLENLTKYAVGTNLVAQQDNPLSGMGLMLGIGGVIEAGKGIGWLNKASKNEISEGLVGDELKAAQKAASPFAKGGWRTAAAYTKASENISSAWAKYAEAANVKIAALKNAGGLTSWDTYKLALQDNNAKMITDAIPKPEILAQLNDETKGLYQEVKTALEGKDFKAAEKALTKANALAHGQIKPTGLFGRIGGFLGKYSGISSLNGYMKNFAVDSPTVAKLLKYSKGQGWCAALQGGFELFNIIPAFTQLGVASGIRQIGKSIVKTAASVVGWAAGAAVGAQGGAMLGAAIGMVGGPVGSVIGGALGAVCGLAGGCIGAWLANKGAEKIVGKNEIELANEKKAHQMAVAASQSPEALQTVVAKVQDRIKSEGAESQDAQIAMGSLKNLGAVTSTQTARNNTSFTGNVNANTLEVNTNPLLSALGQNIPALLRNTSGVNNPFQNPMDEDFMASAYFGKPAIS